MGMGCNGIGTDRYPADLYAVGKTDRHRVSLEKTDFAEVYKDTVLEDEPDLEGKDTEKSEEENEDAKTETDIIVKPDGSRVLIMTMQIGGMKTMMSLKISEPTDMPNDSIGKEAAAMKECNRVETTWQGTAQK